MQPGSGDGASSHPETTFVWFALSRSRTLTPDSSMFKFNPVQMRPALANVILTQIVVFEVVTAVKCAPSVNSGPRKFYGSSSFCGPEDSKCQAGEMDSLFNWKFSSEFM